MKNVIDLISVAKEFPDMIVSISVGDLVKANKELIDETVKSLERQLTDANTETYPSADKVAEMLDVSRPTLWRWEKIGYLVPIRVGGKVRYKMSDVKRIIEEQDGEEAAL